MQERRQEIDAAVSEAESARDALATAASKRTAHLDETECLTYAASAARSDLDTARADLHAMRTDLHAVHAELSTLEERVQDEEAARSADLDTARADLHAVHAELSTLQERIREEEAARSAAVDAAQSAYAAAQSAAQSALGDVVARRERAADEATECEELVRRLKAEGAAVACAAEESVRMRGQLLAQVSSGSRLSAVGH